MASRDATHDTSRTRGEGTTKAQKWSLVMGIIFLAAGILGFIPGITVDYDDMTFAGRDGASLLGIFDVNVVHNIVHLLFGVLGLAAAKAHSSARTYLIGSGIAYIALFVFGLIVDQRDTAWNFVAINSSDNWLHLGLAAALLIPGLLFARDERDGRGLDTRTRTIEDVDAVGRAPGARVERERISGS
jgi:hypothetical protein